MRKIRQVTRTSRMARSLSGECPPPGIWMQCTAALDPPYFLVTNCDATIAKAKQLGGKTCVEATDLENVGRFAVLIDAQGAVFAVFQAAK